ncbi:hypothetical protein BH24ACI3_BH24ACI3_03600 [soil metagenome]
MLAASLRPTVRKFYFKITSSHTDQDQLNASLLLGSKFMKRIYASAFLLSSLLFSSLPLAAQRTMREPRKSVESGRTKTKIPATTEFASTRAYTDGSAAYLKWEMAVERNNFGFNIYRIDGDGKNLANNEIVGGSSLLFGSEPVYGETYSFVDPLGRDGSVYMIESVSNDGVTITSTKFAPQFVADLTKVDGFEVEIQRRAAQSLNRHSIEATLSPPKSLISEIEAAITAPDPTSHRWVVTQPGVRIGVKQVGMHRVLREELAIGGFDVNSDHTQWQLYLQGNEQAIRVGPNGEYIEFMGKGIDTPESDTQTYFLINGPSLGKRILIRSGRLGTSTVRAPNYDQTFLLKERTNFSNNIRNGDAENFWGRAVTPTGTTLPFTLTGVDFDKPTVTMNLKMQGISSGIHQVQLTLNGNPLTVATGGGPFPYSLVQTIPTSFLVEGANTLHMQSTTTGDNSFFDTLELSFSRKHVADQGSARFYTQTNKSAMLTGFTSSNLRVIDTTFANDPQEIIGLTPLESAGTFSLNIPAGRARVFHVFEAGTINSAVSIAPYETELLGSPTHGAELIVITHKNFQAEAAGWANYRAGQGVSVKVVDATEIFDEFNYGVLSADSIKSFLGYAKANWQTTPAYVLFIGDATYDPRRYLGFPDYNFVPTKMINTIFSETASDEFLADFNNDGLAELAVGRIPGRTIEQISIAMSKMVRWEANLTAPSARGTLFAYDLPIGYDFEGMSNRIRNELPAGTPATMVGRGDTEAQASLLTAVNSGKYIVNYSGHGSATAWAATSFFSSNNVTCTDGQTHCVNNPNSESLFTMLTCLNGFFISPTPSGGSLAEALLFSDNGGAVAAWASTGLTTPDVQEVMAKRFYNRIGAGTIPRLGDLIRDAKTIIPGGTDVRLSWTLIGDPMLKVR